MHYALKFFYYFFLMTIAVMSSEKSEAFCAWS